MNGSNYAATSPAIFFGNAVFTGNLHGIPIANSQRTVEEWFNVNAGFDRNSADALASNVRTLSTRFSSIRGDGQNNMDLSLFKNMRVKENGLYSRIYG
jgi:hypothetical protein